MGNSESEVRKLHQVVPLGQFFFDCEEHLATAFSIGCLFCRILLYISTSLWFSFDCEENFATAFSIGCLLYITVSSWALINASFYLFGFQDCKSICVGGVCGVCVYVCVCVFNGPLQIILEFSSVEYVISFFLRL